MGLTPGEIKKPSRTRPQEKNRSLVSPRVRFHLLGVVIQPYVRQCGRETNERVDLRCVCVCMPVCKGEGGVYGVCVQCTEVEVPSQMAAVKSTHTHS